MANMLILTFTESAKTELEKRIKEFLPLETLNISDNDKITIKTFHAFAIETLKTYDQFYKSAKLISSKNQLKFLREYIVFGCGEILLDVDLLPRLNMIRFCQFMDIPKFNSPYHLELNRQYVEMLRNESLFDYTQVLIDFYQNIKNNPACIKYIQTKFKNVIVDEFQDTSVLQARIFIEITKKSTSWVVVGDPFQKIYNFTIFNDPSSFKCLEDNVNNMIKQRLTRNRRSSPGIISAYYSFWDKKQRIEYKQKDCLTLVKCITHNGQTRAIFSIINSMLTKKPNSTIAVIFRTKKMYWANKKIKLYQSLSRLLNHSNIKFYAVPKTSVENSEKEQKNKLLRPPGYNVYFDTIHNYKGGEADYVIIPHFSDGIIPRYDSSKIKKLEYLTMREKVKRHETNEKRLAYVAITRPKKHLFMIHAEYPRPEKSPCKAAFRYLPDQRLKVSPYFRKIKRYTTVVDISYLEGFLGKMVSSNPHI